MKNRKRQAGMTSVLAMLFLVLFTTMAVGFYAATTTAMHVTANDERVSRAFVSSESGLDYMRYQLANVSVPPTTPPDQVIDFLYADLQAQLDGTGNLGSLTIGRSGNTIQIPAGTGRIPLDASGISNFRATITDWAGEIVVKIDGGYGATENAARSITMDFTRQENTTTAFDYAIASRGQVLVKKGMITAVTGVDPSIATIMSASPTPGAVTVTGGTIGGDLNHIDGGSAVVTGGNVGGSSIPSNILAYHTHEVDEPEFPSIDTTVFKPYATNAYVSGKGTQQNIFIPPNTNPKFNGNSTIQGIMYVASPNVIEITGNFSLQGFIVMEPGASTTDAIESSGNFTMSPLPSAPEFDPLRATSGIAILAPSAAARFTGSSAGVSLKGSLMVKKFSLKGASSMQIDQGTIMTFDPGSESVLVDGSKSIKFTATGGSNQPKVGVSYSTHYIPKPATYQEVAP